MVTISKVIERVDAIRPNAFSSETKTAWLAELDGQLALNVMLMDISQVQVLRYAWPEDAETKLLVSFPHDGIYDHWLIAMIDYHNGEYDKYQNSMEMYNKCYSQFANWFIRTYDPAQGHAKEGI